MTQFPSAWNVRPLGELVDVLDARRSPVSAKERAKRLGDVPYYGATGQVGWIDHALFNEPLVLLGEDGVQFLDGEKSKAYLIDGPAWVNNHAHVLRTGEDIDRKFLSYCLNAADYRGFANGTTRLKLTQDAMRRIPIPVPPPGDQRRIVDLLEDHLSHLDAAASLVVASLRRLTALRGSVLAGLYDGDTVPLGQLATNSGYGTSERCVAAGPGPAVVRIPNLVDGEIDLSNEKRVAAAGADVERYRLDPDDLLIVRTNGSVDLIGRSAVVQHGVDAAFASYLIRYQLRLDRVMPRWVQAMLSTPQVRAKVETLAASSAGQHNLSLGKLNPLELPVPALDVQAARLSQLANIDDQIRRLRTDLSSAQARGAQLRRSLLTAAFAGRLTGAGSDLSAAGEMMDDSRHTDAREG